MNDKVEGGGGYLNDKVEGGGYLNDKVEGVCVCVCVCVCGGGVI